MTPAGVVLQGQKRKTHLTIQGRFKRELEFNEVFTGQEFRRPLKHLPPTTLLSVLIRFGKKLSPSMMAGFTPIPHILTPVVAAAQVRAAELNNVTLWLICCCVVSWLKPLVHYSANRHIVCDNPEPSFWC